MKSRLISLICLMVCLTGIARADDPFRNHRYNAFTTLKVDTSSIVFVGNSITNLHEWWEAFGCNAKVLNRGVSGSYSDEVLANLENVIMGHPAKIFFMIGTNDLGMYGNKTAKIAANVREIVARVKKESPKTEIYLQSVLPTEVGKRTLPAEREINDSLKKICTDCNLTYVDLWDLLIDIPSKNPLSMSNDGLHLTVKGYYQWCNAIAPIVGSKCVYTNGENNYGGVDKLYGMRVTQFGDLPVCKEDVLLIGDEVVTGGEWHELLNSTKIKSRGNAWDYPGRPLSVTLASIPVILQGREGNEQPAKVFLYAGVREVNGNKNVAASAVEYRKVVDKIREMAPNTKIYLMAHLPQANAKLSKRAKDFNLQLQIIAEDMEGVTYVDTYTPFVKGSGINPEYMMGNYLTGLGYNRLARVLADYLVEEGVSVMDEDEARELAATYEARNAAYIRSVRMKK